MTSRRTWKKPFQKYQRPNKQAVKRDRERQRFRDPFKDSKMLRTITIPRFQNSAGSVQDIQLYYQVYGLALGKAPVVLVNHSLTGDSRVTGKKGWWSPLVGAGMPIDTEHYTVLAINVPGNGKGADHQGVLEGYREFTLKDMARLFLEALKTLKIDSLFALIGGSIGGALAWEMAAIQPGLATHLIPIAADFKTTDWIRAQCRIQEQILDHSPRPLRDARVHAMTLYRSPQSFAHKFNREKEPSGRGYAVDSWLSHHGNELEGRWSLSAYRLMNHLLRTIDIAGRDGDPIRAAAQIKSEIHIVAIDSDLLFPAAENRKDYERLAARKPDVHYWEICSLHGHDGFFIEYEQLKKILYPIFKPHKINAYENDSRSAFWHR